MRAFLLASAAAAVSALTWYGAAPDDTVPGLINIFSMTPDGRPISEVAAVRTSDQEYPKDGTFHCHWTTPLCYFATGVAQPYVSDAIYAVNRQTGAVAFKHVPPAGVYFDNLVYDYAHDYLAYVAFDFRIHAARLVKLSTTTGNITSITDISADVRNGFVFAGGVSLCAQEQHLFVGVDQRDGEFHDYILRYDLSADPPRLMDAFPLANPIPAGTHAFCNDTSLVALIGATIQADSQDKETAILGDFHAAGREGVLVPFVRGNLPTFHDRNDIPLFMQGVISEHAGLFVVPVYPPFRLGPGPHPPVPIGFVWNVQFVPGGPHIETLNLIDYYLAGASGVPNT